MEYPELFLSGTIGRAIVKNRIVMAALGTGLARPDGGPSEEILRFYTERAQGGVGLIVTEITRVNDDTGVGMLRQLSLSSDRLVPEARRLTEAVHRNGSALFFQLHHPGRSGHPALIGGKQIVAPSAIPMKPDGFVPRALEESEIKALTDDFARAARRAQEAGADGVELHAAHGYLIGQFLSPFSNKRTDEYGGALENRTRFLREILQAIRATCGDFPVAVRISVDEFLDLVGFSDEPYVTMEEGVRIAGLCEEWGASAIDVSCGLPVSGFTTVEPASFEEGWKGYLAEAVREAVRIPVIAVNKIRTPETAAVMIRTGQADFAALGRQLLADPQWSRKVAEGREDEIRRCVSCRSCMKRVWSGKSIACSLASR